MSAYRSFPAGAGVVEAVSVHPMDMIKTRQQLCTASVRPTILGTTRALLAEGGARRLYRGLFPEIIGQPCTLNPALYTQNPTPKPLNHNP